MNNRYTDLHMNDELDYLTITIGDNSIFVMLAPLEKGKHAGKYQANVYGAGMMKMLAEFHEDNPALAIARCKQWIADNPIIESDEVQA